MDSLHSRHPVAARVLLLLVSSIWLSSVALAQAPPNSAVPAGTIFRLSLARAVHPDALRPGSLLEGELANPIFSQGMPVLPAGSHLRLVVAKIESTKVHAGLLREIETFGRSGEASYQFTIDSGTLTLPDGSTVNPQLEFLRWANVVKLRAKGNQVAVGESAGKALAKHAPGLGKVETVKEARSEYQRHKHPLMTLRLTAPLQLPVAVNATTAAPSGPVVIPAGMHAQLVLLSELDSTKSKTGDPYQAQLLEPIISEGKVVLPEGTILEGHVRRSVAPKRLSRGGFLLLGFDSIQLENGAAEKMEASLAGMEADPHSKIHLDPEGGMHGNRRGPKGVMADLGEALLLQQATDEAVELAVHAVAPYAGAGVGLFVFLGKHGHNVTLPKYSEIDIEFGRAVTLTQPQTQSHATN